MGVLKCYHQARCGCCAVLRRAGAADRAPGRCHPRRADPPCRLPAVQDAAGVRVRGLLDRVESLLSSDSDPQVVANCLYVMQQVAYERGECAAGWGGAWRGCCGLEWAQRRPARCRPRVHALRSCRRRARAGGHAGGARHAAAGGVAAQPHPLLQRLGPVLCAGAGGPLPPRLRGGAVRHPGGGGGWWCQCVFVGGSGVCGCLGVGCQWGLCRAAAHSVHVESAPACAGRPHLPCSLVPHPTVSPCRSARRYWTLGSTTPTLLWSWPQLSSSCTTPWGSLRSTSRWAAPRQGRLGAPAAERPAPHRRLPPTLPYAPSHTRAPMRRCWRRSRTRCRRWCRGGSQRWCGRCSPTSCCWRSATRWPSRRWGGAAGGGWGEGGR